MGPRLSKEVLSEGDNEVFGQSGALRQLTRAVKAAEACLTLAWHKLVVMLPMLFIHDLRGAEAPPEMVAGSMHLPAQPAHLLGQLGACGPGKGLAGDVEVLQVLEEP